MYRNHYGRNLRTAVGASGAPYGFTLAIWTSGALLVHSDGLPSTFDALSFMVGSVLAFAFIGTLAFGGIGAHFEEEPRQSALWGNFHFFSVGAAIGMATLTVHHVQGRLVWPLAAFVVTAVYLLVLGAEFSLSDRRDPKKG